MEVDQVGAWRQISEMQGIARSVVSAFCLSGFIGLAGLAQPTELSPDTFLNESDFMQFITVEADEVRIELIARCEALVEALDFQLNDASVISPEEQAALIEAARQYFGRQFTFFPEGVPIPPKSARGDILRLGAIDSVVKEHRVEERLSEAVLGVAYSYPLEERISYFEFSWNRLPGRAARIPVQISTPEGVQSFEFSNFVRSLDWTGKPGIFQQPELKPVPVGEKTWMGRAKLDQRSASRILSELIANIYSAFDSPTDPAIYDNLAKSVAGAALNDIYLEYRERIEALRRGDPSVEVLSVSIEDIHSIRRAKKNYVIHASWRVFGRVRHFGHVHERVNRYEAALTLIADRDIWKLLEIEIMEESRL